MVCSCGCATGRSCFAGKPSEDPDRLGAVMGFLSRRGDGLDTRALLRRFAGADDDAGPECGRSTDQQIMSVYQGLPRVSPMCSICITLYTPAGECRELPRAWPG